MKLKLNRTVVFWTALVSGVLLFAQQVANLFGVAISDTLVADIMVAVSTLLSLFVLVGVLTNSDQADTFETKVFKK